MVTSKILNPRKIEENERESRNIGFEADMLIIFKFPYNFFFTTSLSVHSEPQPSASQIHADFGAHFVETPARFQQTCLCS